ncbi:MAG: tRNA glutamyl-Q(34) synthetase GluQRS [Gammaproteobacteria bacterium]|nr:tRNA glutamyl-Q(34) synthetase GluQRS [Gammaproteobacteria bacterium]
MSVSTTQYRGRFAPSPTGPLHMGSLIAALASYLDARSNNGSWLLRIDDIDPPREAPGATDSILASLAQHGLYWDNDIIFQSHNTHRYAAALQHLRGLADGTAVFACVCSRAAMGPGGVCCGTCREQPPAGDRPHALRIAVPASQLIRCEDALQGPQCWELGHIAADFVLRRKDGLWAYQLAAAVDDTENGITHVVRGSDLLDSTPRQLFLQALLGKTAPQYCHLPVIVNSNGQKLSKQNHAAPLDNTNAVRNLRVALQFLGQLPPPASLTAVDALLHFATQAWQLARVPAQLARPAAEVGWPG